MGALISRLEDGIQEQPHLRLPGLQQLLIRPGGVGLLLWLLFLNLTQDFKIYMTQWLALSTPRTIPNHCLGSDSRNTLLAYADTALGKCLIVWIGNKWLLLD